MGIVVVSAVEGKDGEDRHGCVHEKQIKIDIRAKEHIRH